MASEPRGCLGAIFELFGGAQAGGTRETPQVVTRGIFPYVPKARFLSPAESSFLAALRVAAAEEYEIFSLVRLLDVLTVKTGSGHQTAMNKVDRKQLDFLLCERGTTRPVLALELDDSSHQRAARQGRDAFVEEVLEDIGLPLLRMPVTRTYDPREIARLVKVTLSDAPAAPES